MKKKLKIKTRFGRVEVPHGHLLSTSGANFGISPYLQELECIFGRDEIYETGSRNLEQILHISVNKKQIERVTKHYGRLAEGLLKEESKNDIPVKLKDEKVYAMMDGSMIFTRTGEWKEAKLGRLFHSKTLHTLSSTRNWIKDSVYAAHIGTQTEFLKKLEPLTDKYDGNLVFVCDGARWIWKWINESYPDSIQILDYYHAVENLSKFVSLTFRKKAKGKEWREQQVALISEGKIQEVIENIELINCKNQTQKKEQNRLINYYKINESRMQYKAFKEQGLLIGSGAIEAAHRTVIQRRMKLSGQRWTIEGAQQVLNLRVANMSGHWDKIIDLIDHRIRA